MNTIPIPPISEFLYEDFMLPLHLNAQAVVNMADISLASIRDILADLNNILEYKGYRTHIGIDFESHMLHGRIDGIRDLVNFESETIDGIIREFHCAVDDYLNFCATLGDELDIPDYAPRIAEYA